LAHPVIAAPIATGTDGLVIYLAQEYVPADSLDVVLRDEGPPVPADALRVASQLAGALDFAAAAGVYHGVLHPRDVLIAQDDTRLTGLGVAGAIEKIGVAAPRRRPYTAPERMAGTAWDRRADIFSLAALIHEMLWGRRLTSIGAEAAGALTDLPGANLARLKAAFARALAPDPGDRFERAVDFSTALGDAFPHLRIAPDPVSVRLQADTPDEDEDEDATDARLPFETERRNGSLETVLVSGARDDLQTVGVDEAGAGHGSDDLELRPAEATHGHEVEVEIAPARVREAAGDPAEPTTVSAPMRITPLPLEEAPPLRNGFHTVTGSASRAPLFQSYQADSPQRSDPRLDGRLDVRDEPDEAREPPRSVMAPMAAALTVGLALGFAGGYVLGGRRGAPAVASAPPAAAPSKSADAKAPPGREFTETAVSEGPPTPAPGARPSTPIRPAVEPPSGTGEKGPTRGAAASATAPGRLLVRSTPAGARVFVDGREQGQTPATIRDLARGTHRVRITLDGYAAEERRVALTAAQPSQAMTVDLKRTGAPAAARSTGSPVAPAAVAPAGALTVDSRPDGARVFLDGRLVGTTPLSLPQVAAGEHAVRLEREGYRRWSSSVRVAGGQGQRVTASLER
jgi:serine/threonine-protein kinase